VRDERDHSTPMRRKRGDETSPSPKQLAVPSFMRKK
jgi:hypothetical protein